MALSYFFTCVFIVPKCKISAVDIEIIMLHDMESLPFFRSHLGCNCSIHAVIKGWYLRSLCRIRTSIWINSIPSADSLSLPVGVRMWKKTIQQIWHFYNGFVKWNAFIWLKCAFAGIYVALINGNCYYCAHTFFFFHFPPFFWSIWWRSEVFILIFVLTALIKWWISAE